MSTDPYTSAVNSIRSKVRKPKGRSSIYPKNGLEPMKLSMNALQMGKSKGAKARKGSRGMK